MVLWLVAAALAAGILREATYLWVALFLTFHIVNRHRSTRKQASAVCLIVLLFFTYGFLAMRGYDERLQHFNRVAKRHAGTIPIEGWVSGFPMFSYGRTSFEFTGRVGDVWLRVLAQTYEFDIGYGDSLRLVGFLGPSKRAKYSRERYLRGRGLHGLVRVVPGGVEHLQGVGGNAVSRRLLWPVHDRLRRDINKGVGARAGIPLALLVGERGLLDRRLRQAFVVLGISHLLALSGLHLGFVVGVLLLFVRRMPGWRGRILLIALTLYVGIVGPIFSLYRAFVMAAVLICARTIHRPMRPVSALGAAFILIALIYPNALFSLGFQLSFLATFGVLLCVARFGLSGGSGTLQRIKSYVISTIVISLAVQILVAPVILYYFGRVSVMSPVATVLFVFPVAILLFGSALCAVVSAAVPSAAVPFYTLLDRAAYFLGEALEVGARWSPAPLELPVPNPFLYFGGVVLLWRRKSVAWMRLVGVCVLVAAFLV